MAKPIYPYPEFVKRIELSEKAGRRYWLRLTLNEQAEEEICVILKNPSRANKEVSDKTVYNVVSYIHQNQHKYAALRNVGKISILNLIPYYLTYSDQLKSIQKLLIDPENLKTLDEFTTEVKKVIIAWGNAPKGLEEEYRFLKEAVKKILEKNGNQIYYVDRFTLSGNPKHGQVWRYRDELIDLGKREF